MRNRVLGMIIGGAIGDALGAPVETWTPEKIREVHPPEGVTKYVPPIGHRWFDPDKFPPGTTTDDTQLSLATMKGLRLGQSDPVSIASYMDAIAHAHCLAMQDSTAGWGASTKEAIRRLQNNVHWSEAGKTHHANRGTGNGVPMKIAPLGAWKVSPVGKQYAMALRDPSFAQFCVLYSAMTHYTKMSAYAGLIHAHACAMCLESAPDQLDLQDFMAMCVEIFSWNEQIPGIYDVSFLNNTDDELVQEFQKLWQEFSYDTKSVKAESLRENFGNGSCYVLHSLPFTYGFFLAYINNPVQGLIDLVNAGGDTDTNASMLGNLLGALHGIELFEQSEHRWMIEGLQGYGELREETEKFCDVFGL